MSAPVELLTERLGRLQAALRETHDAPMLVTDPANVGWLTDVPADFQKDAHLLVFPDRAYFITDGRYENRVPEIPGVEPFIWASKHPHRYPELRELLEGAGALVLDTRGLPLDVFQVLPRMVGVENLEVPPGFIDRLRMIKGERELALIREAVALAIAQFRHMVEEWLPANLDTATDMDFRDELEAWPLQRGGEGPSFEALVAMDADADTPHPDMTRPPRPLREGKVMLVDWGIKYKGVCTDMTRMILLQGELPPIFEGMKLLQEKWMAAVEAKILPGLPACEAGEEYAAGMEAAGIAKPFHSAGHGTGGAYVHELPLVGRLQEGVEDFGIPFRQGIVLEPGMIVTNEPGMYEKGEGAYRTENMLLVTENGHEILDAALPLEPFTVGG